MAANRFAVLTEESFADSVDSPSKAKPADKFDTTTLSAALKGARQAFLALSCIQFGKPPSDLQAVLCSIKQESEAVTKAAAGKKQKITHRQPLVWVDLEMTGMCAACCIVVSDQTEEPTAITMLLVVMQALTCRRTQ